jgi:putative sugar O-methyltransferase
MSKQASDDFELLELMMADLRSAPAEFSPTNYWAVYERRFLPQLRASGLVDFRRRGDAVFRSFGAVDFVHPVAELRLHDSRVFRSPPAQWLPGIQSLAVKLDQLLSRYIRTLDGLDPEAYVRLGYHFAEAYAKNTHARPINQLSMSLVGNPDNVVDIEGRSYTRQTIQYYLQYAYISRFVDFESLETVAELGSGMGRQTEIFSKLHPNVTYLLFDLPPQIYVAEQYLKAVFPDRVVSYRQTRDWTSIDALKPGQIVILGNHQFPLVAKRPIDLFWNSASFHEMEPDIVRHYLGFVDATTRWVYLSENLKGGVKAKQEGNLGILNVTTRDDYLSALPNFECVDTSPALRINGKPLKDTQMVFRRRT